MDEDIEIDKPPADSLINCPTSIFETSKLGGELINLVEPGTRSSAEILRDPQGTSASREGQSPKIAHVTTSREKLVDDLDGKSPKTPLSQE